MSCVAKRSWTRSKNFSRGDWCGGDSTNSYIYTAISLFSLRKNWKLPITRRSVTFWTLNDCIIWLSTFLPSFHSFKLYHTKTWHANRLLSYIHKIHVAPTLQILNFWQAWTASILHLDHSVTISLSNTDWILVACPGGTQIWVGQGCAARASKPIRYPWVIYSYPSLRVILAKKGTHF